jgi:hypothetical protein
MTRMTLDAAIRDIAIPGVVGVMVLGRTDFILFAAILFLVQTPVLLGTVAIRRLRVSTSS